MLQSADDLAAPDVDRNGSGFDPEPVDLKHLKRYTLDDADLEREVLALFLAQLPRSIAALATSTTEREWRMAAHAIKGSGRAVGAWSVARLAEQAERAGDRCPRNSREMLSLIAAAGEEVRAFVVSRYGALPPVTADA
jgi:HPt (histidine-containing phosphotransfer) domain-containing protein